MIIVQTPLRVSFFGGGTDFPGYFREHGGCVLSTTIDKYIFVTIKKRFDQKLRIGWTRTEMVDSLGEIQHELIRESLRMVGVQRGVEITTMGDIPSAGTGLGSSSTVTVGALHAIHAYRGRLVTARQLAEEACKIELDILGKPIGIQDQYIAAYGGLRFFRFEKDGTIHSEWIAINTDTIRCLNQNILLFFTGLTRKADKILKEQKENISDRAMILGEMKDIACYARDEIARNNVDVIGDLLHKSWMLKKQLASKISNPAIDEMYSAAMAAGATGGKITGAGGGGFMLLYCPPTAQSAVRYALRHLQELPFRLDQDGSKVIFNHRRP